MCKVMMLLKRSSGEADLGIFGSRQGAVRSQALDIINEIINGTDPAEQQIRARLVECVARHPGRPEEALLEHLTHRDNGIRQVIVT